MKEIGKNLERLIKISSEPISPFAPSGFKTRCNIIEQELIELLSRKNGFYAFESALHVYPSGAECGQYTLEQWNAPEMWKQQYGDVAVNLLCFAENIFGDQFAIHGDKICRFDSETGECEDFAFNLEEWAEKILLDYNYETGFPLAHAWQEQHGALKPGQRLIPKVPFVLGGDYDVANLFACAALKGMHLRADIYRQIKDLPDGAKIKFEITE